MCEDQKIKRRKVMQWIVAGIGVSSGTILGVPALVNALSPVIRHTKRESQWRLVGALELFPVGKIISRKVETRLTRQFLTMAKNVFVWRKSSEEVVVYSRSCTDLGCPVNYDPGSECFFCPCHGGIFSKEGERMAGPPKSPMYRYRYRIVDGFLEIDLSSVPLMV
jgi:menaquinol-cytochrome c reductase iron-sulfur subunit